MVGDLDEVEVSGDAASAWMIGGACSVSRHMMHWSGSVIVADVEVSMQSLVIHKIREEMKKPAAATVRVDELQTEALLQARRGACR